MTRSWPAPLALCHRTALFLLPLLLSLSVDQAVSTHIVTGTPPTFTQEPQDVVVFALDAAGNNASLSLQCAATGDPSPNITWFRGGQPLGNEVVMADGSLLIENITEGVDATRGGLSYYCTANNTFGTIRSRTATVSYAYFDGFDGPSGVEVVSVATGENGNVALECRVRDANPPPQIQWFDENDMPLTEVTTNNLLRFLDNGRYLLIRTLTTAQVNTNYYCSVTNVHFHETMRSPTTYDLDDTLGSNEIVIYKSFVDRTLTLVGGGTGTVQWSYIAGAGTGAGTFGLVTCRRTRIGSTSTPRQTLILSQVGGVIDETIPRGGDIIPSVAESVTVEVSCPLVGAGQTNTSRATLTVLVSPQITMEPTNDLEQLVGGSITFTCVTSGIPTPEVTWYFNGMPLTANGVISISGGTLDISTLAVAHTGMYQCFVSNTVNTIQTSWALQVRAPVIPVVLDSSSEGAVVDDYVGPLVVVPSGEETTTLFALVTGDPCPTIQWRLNGNNISQNSIYTISDPCPLSGSPGSPPYNFTLTINVTTDTALGTYTAAVTNAAGTVPVAMVVVTTPVPVGVTGLRLPSSPLCLLSGTSVIIRCLNTGFPRPVITFSRGTLDITPGIAPFVHFQQLRFDTLNLTMVQSDDEAEYVCRASRGATVIRSAPIDLVFCTLPNIEELEMPMTHTEGDMLVLVCLFSGIPDVTIRWEKDEVVFSPQEGRRIISSPIVNGTGQSQLEINTLALSDAGLYNCTASNIAGTTSRSVRLEVRERPAAPLLTTEAIIGIAVGGVGGILLIILVILLLCCVYFCARHGKQETMIVTTTKGGYGNDFTDARGNVDRDSDEEEGQPEAFNPQYESLPALRPAQPPQYKPTPNYPHGAPLSGDDIEMTKVPPPDTDSTHFSEFMNTPYGKQAPPSFPRAGQW